MNQWMSIIPSSCWWPTTKKIVSCSLGILDFCCHHLLCLYNVRMENVCHNPNSWSFNPVHWAIHSTLKFTTTFLPILRRMRAWVKIRYTWSPPNRCIVLPNHFICGPNSSWIFPYPVPLSTKICADFMTQRSLIFSCCCSPLLLLQSPDFCCLKPPYILDPLGRCPKIAHFFLECRTHRKQDVYSLTPTTFN